MATIRDGSQPVLMIVDLQAGVVAHAWEAEQVVARAAAAAERARAAGVPVVWVQHADAELVEGSVEWALADGLVPTPDEPIVHKRFNSSFEETELDELLARLGATEVVLAGAATNWCIRATAYGALDRGYDVTLVSDAHTTESLDHGDGRVVPAEHLIDDLNTCLQWVSYPGRTTRSLTTAELSF